MDFFVLEEGKEKDERKEICIVWNRSSTNIIKMYMENLIN
mgnify:CR=1 FL=1